jgi:hypothetical protein
VGLLASAIHDSINRVLAVLEEPLIPPASRASAPILEDERIGAQVTPLRRDTRSRPGTAGAVVRLL